MKGNSFKRHSLHRKQGVPFTSTPWFETLPGSTNPYSWIVHVNAFNGFILKVESKYQQQKKGKTKSQLKLLNGSSPPWSAPPNWQQILDPSVWCSWYSAKSTGSQGHLAKKITSKSWIDDLLLYLIVSCEESAIKTVMHYCALVVLKHERARTGMLQRLSVLFC